MPSKFLKIVISQMYFFLVANWQPLHSMVKSNTGEHMLNNIKILYSNNIKHAQVTQTIAVAVWTPAVGTQLSVSTVTDCE